MAGVPRGCEWASGAGCGRWGATMWIWGWKNIWYMQPKLKRSCEDRVFGTSPFLCWYLLFLNRLGGQIEPYWATFFCISVERITPKKPFISAYLLLAPDESFGIRKNRSHNLHDHHCLHSFFSRVISPSCAILRGLYLTSFSSNHNNTTNDW